VRFRIVGGFFIGLVMLLSLPVLASAQEISYGIKGGFNTANLKVSFDDVDVTGDRRTGLLLGAFVARDFNPNVGIQVEGLFTQKGSEFAAETNLFDDDASLKLNYIEFPVLARVNVPAAATTVRLLAGPTFGFKVSQSVDVGNVELDADEVPLKSFDLGFALGGAVEIRQFVIDARYTWGLTDINDGEEPEEPTVKNNAFSLSFGWRFK
jgi:hypothetical protein